MCVTLICIHVFVTVLSMHDVPYGVFRFRFSEYLHAFLHTKRLRCLRFSQLYKSLKIHVYENVIMLAKQEKIYIGGGWSW